MPPYNPETVIASQLQTIRRLRAENAGLRIVRGLLIEQLRQQHRQHTTTRSPAECPYCGTAWAVAMWGERMKV